MMYRPFNYLTALLLLAALIPLAGCDNPPADPGVNGSQSITPPGVGSVYRYRVVSYGWQDMPYDTTYRLYTVSRGKMLSTGEPVITVISYEEGKDSATSASRWEIRYTAGGDIVLMDMATPMVSQKEIDLTLPLRSHTTIIPPPGYYLTDDPAHSLWRADTTYDTISYKGNRMMKVGNISYHADGARWMEHTIADTEFMGDHTYEEILIEWEYWYLAGAGMFGSMTQTVDSRKKLAADPRFGRINRHEYTLVSFTRK